MITKIKSICSQNFKGIMKGIKLMDKYHGGLFNTIQYNTFGESKKSYEGHLLCGEASFITKYLLEKNGHHVDVVRNHFGYGRYLEDHCFLYVDNKYIVDPTYRQFLGDSRTENKHDDYIKYIYELLPPIFIGKKEDLKMELNNILNINKEEYGSNLITFNDLHSHWNFDDYITNNYNFKKVTKNNPKYTKIKEFV